MHPNETLARRWCEEVWNQGSEETMEELLHAEAHAHDFPIPGRAAGREEFKQGIRDFRSTFGDMEFFTDDIIATEDTIVIRWHLTARHTGPGLGFAPTFQPVGLHGISMARIRDGKIEQGWNALDMTRVVHELKDAPVIS